nr:MAG TPA: hypothetical protein [Caudoviricetes sp.]DAU10817.1 MAG TPA: hypothetical protein [Caudoviricetes sp.]
MVVTIFRLHLDSTTCGTFEKNLLSKLIQKILICFGK